MNHKCVCVCVCEFAQIKKKWHKKSTVTKRRRKKFGASVGGLKKTKFKTSCHYAYFLKQREGEREAFKINTKIKENAWQQITVKIKMKNI